jgi:TldD protein
MLDSDALTKYLAKIRGIRYADIRTLGKNCVEITLRNDSLEVGEHNDSIVGCRALDKGYGVSSTNKVEKGSIEAALDHAVEHATSINGNVNLMQVRPEHGSYEHPVKKKPGLDDMQNFIMQVRDAISDKVSSLTNRVEVVLSYTEFSTGLVTSEGTDVRESFSTTDLTISLTVRTESGVLTTKKIVGGKGGMETIQHRDLESINDELARTLRSSAGAKQFSPLESGKKFRIILDSEAAGALTRLIAHMLSADEFKSKVFYGLNLPKELEIVDNPSIPGAYGSFMWDDEGVRGMKKVLISNGAVNLLHTRLTAKDRDSPGNAHGISHVPRPSLSNVYISTSDWHLDEMLDDTKEGIFMKGVNRAEINTGSGIVELEPVVAYIIEKKEIKEAIKNVMLIDSVRNLMQKIDAIGKLISLIPNTEKGFGISEGAPYIRIDGARCAYSVMQ